MFARIQALEHKLRRLGISAHACRELEAEIATLRAAWDAKPILDRLKAFDCHKVYVPLKDGCVDGRLTRCTAQYWRVGCTLIDAAKVDDVTPYGRIVV
jgi:hypothetical protein